VPISKDQLPVIKQAREIARKFNRIYGQMFKLSEARVGDFPRVLGMDGCKMGKSLNNSITFTDSPETIRKKIKGARLQVKWVEKTY
jgi:tryptophanyl-tRNA synthetase